MNRLLRGLLSYILFLCWVAVLSCGEESGLIKPSYRFIEPQYELVGIRSSSDTISFLLDDQTYNEIKSFNLFVQNGFEYISFFDRNSGSIVIYDFQTRKLIERISLKKSFHNQELYKTTVFVKSFDSILVTNKTKIYLLDSSGRIYNSIEFLKKPKYAWAALENTNPPYWANKMLYASVRPYVKASSLNALKEWRVLYVFDFENRKVNLKYALPELYTKNYYGTHFLDYNYCYNERGNFVLSFPADTNIYETNLTDYHMAYYAKSQYQFEPITPIDKKSIEKGKESEQFYIRDSYGPVFYDAYRKRYLRLARQKISQSDYLNKNRKRRQSIIIMDDGFRIIGESEVDYSLSFNTLFFDSNGKMYVRVNAKDEYALHFVRLSYDDNRDDFRNLTQNNTRVCF